MIILILTIAIRLIILISPFVIFLFLSAKKRLKFSSLLIVIILLCNSALMLFSNNNQKSIIEMNSLDINKVKEFFSDIEYNESRTNYGIYIYDKKYMFNEIATFNDITYRKYHVGNDINNTLKEFVTDSDILKQIPQFIQNDYGINFYASDIKHKMNWYDLLYNNSIFNGCIIIENLDEIYYVEYEVELSGPATIGVSILEQTFYKLKFYYKIDVMELFEIQMV